MQRLSCERVTRADALDTAFIHKAGVQVIPQTPEAQLRFFCYSMLALSILVITLVDKNRLQAYDFADDKNQVSGGDKDNDPPWHESFVVRLEWWAFALGCVGMFTNAMAMLAMSSDSDAGPDSKRSGGQELVILACLGTPIVAFLLLAASVHSMVACGTFLSAMAVLALFSATRKKSPSELSQDEKQKSV